MGRVLFALIALLALTAPAPHPRVNQTATNSDDTLLALNMGDEVALWIEPDPRARRYDFQVSKHHRGRWTTLWSTPAPLLHNERSFVDNLDCVPGRFMPDPTTDYVYYRVLLVNDRGRVFRIFPPVRVPPWIDEHPEDASAPIDPNTPITEMNAVDPSQAVDSGC